MQSKLLCKIIAFITLFSLIINFTLYDEFYNFLSNSMNILGTKNDLKQKDIKINHVNEWIINGNITQYSSYILTEEGFFKNYYYIEAFVILTRELESKNINLLEYLKCFYKTEKGIIQKSNATYLKKISFMNVKGFPKKLHRINCKIQINNTSFVTVAIISENEFGKDKIPEDYIEFQEPRVKKIDKEDSLRNGVAHCVHLLRNVEGSRSKRLFDWIEMQKRIGISEISLYTYNVSNEVVDRLNKKYSNGYVKIVKYLTKYEDVCRIPVLNFEKNRESAIHENLLNICKNAYSYHFDMSDDLVMNTHERINTNDCFFNYKYDYKYVTTYDIDELILPRHYKLDYHNDNEFNCENTTYPRLNYNIFKFADDLFKKHSNRPSCIEFENVVFFSNDDLHLLNFTSYLYNNSAISNELSIQSIDKKVSYVLDSLDYIKTLKSKINLAFCLIKNSTINSSFDILWNRVFATLMNMRNGKSIFNTDNTEGINQHYTDIAKSNKNIHVKVPLNDAFCGHNREFINLFFNNQKYSIKHFVVDIEFLLFLLNFSEK
jgi:hypothetical protein